MRRKRDFFSLALMAVIICLTLWIVLGGGNAAGIWAAMKLARWPWLLLGGLLMVCYTCVEALQNKLTLAAMGHRVAYGHCCQFAAAGFYFSSITPSATGGQPAEVLYMNRRGIPAAHGALVMLLFTIIYQITMLGYGLAAWLFSPGLTASLGTGLGVLLGYGLTAMLLLTAGMVALLLWPQPVERLCRWLLSLGVRLRIVRDPARAEEGLDSQMEEYAKGAELIRGRPLLFLTLLALAILQQGARFLIPWAVYRALGLSGYGVVEIVGTQALVSLAVGCLPIPGAVGASEAAFLTACQTIYGSELVAAAMLLSRGLSFYLPLVVTGGITALLHVQTGKRPLAVEGKIS